MVRMADVSVSTAPEEGLGPTMTDEQRAKMYFAALALATLVNTSKGVSDLPARLKAANAKLQAACHIIVHPDSPDTWSNPACEKRMGF